MKPRTHIKRMVVVPKNRSVQAGILGLIIGAAAAAALLYFKRPELPPTVESIGRHVCVDHKGLAGIDPPLIDGLWYHFRCGNGERVRTTINYVEEEKRDE